MLRINMQMGCQSAGINVEDEFVRQMDLAHCSYSSLTYLFRYVLGDKPLKFEVQNKLKEWKNPTLPKGWSPCSHSSRATYDF